MGKRSLLFARGGPAGGVHPQATVVILFLFRSQINPLVVDYLENYFVELTFWELILDLEKRTLAASEQ